MFWSSERDRESAIKKRDPETASEDYGALLAPFFNTMTWSTL
jgi:hypothetical protein